MSIAGEEIEEDEVDNPIFEEEDEIWIEELESEEESFEKFWYERCKRKEREAKERAEQAKIERERLEVEKEARKRVQEEEHHASNKNMGDTSSSST